MNAFARYVLLLIAPLLASFTGAVQLSPQGAQPIPWITQGDLPAGAVSWQLLGQARTVQKADKKLGPLFTEDIKALQGRDVKLYGFMLPLDGGTKKQKRFLLTAWPPHCSFCIPGGPETMVEVIMDKPIDFTFDPVFVAGKMSVLENDQVYYRLTSGKPERME